MPQENTKRGAVLAAIESAGAIADLTAKRDGHYEHELDLEIIVFGRNYNGKQVGPYLRLFDYAPGEEIVREGEWGGNTFYVVVSGRAEVYVGADQRSSKIAEVQPGAQFGVMDVLAGVPRDSTVRAPRNQPVRVLEVQRPALRLLKKLPKFGETLDTAYREHGRAVTIQDICRDAGLDKGAAAHLEAISRFQVFPKGHTLFQAGALIERLYVLKSGWARLDPGTRMSAAAGESESRKWNTRANEIHVGPSRCFGLDAVRRDDDWRYTCELTERSEVLEIPILELRSRPELRDGLLQAFSKTAVPNTTGGGEEIFKPLPIALAQEKLIESGLVDATNLLVMDMDLCVRCGNCSMACHRVHGQSRLVRRGIHVTRPVSLEKNAGFQSLLAPAVCFHCKDPECLTGCPTGAIARFPDGQVDIDPKSCIGCADCATQCPYNAISMIPGKPAPTHAFGWRKWFDVSPEPLPPPVEQTEDLVAVKCNLCAETPLNPPGASRPAYSCEENCPTGALLRVDPRAYFAEIRNIEGLIFKDSTHAIARHTSHKDRGKLLAHAAGLGATLISIGLAMMGAIRYGLETPLIGSWLDLRWITGLVSLIAMAGVMTYPVRKQIYKRRAGPLRYWMLGHSYLGVIAGALLVLHGGVKSGGLLTTALIYTFDLVILTGLFGILSYTVAPRALTKIESQPLLIEDLLERREELSNELGSTMAAALPEARELIKKRILSRCLSFEFLLRQYLKRESLDQLIRSVNREAKEAASKLPAYEQGNFFSAVEKAVTIRRLDALIYLHLAMKLWLAPHIVSTSLMLALMIVHIIQVVYFAVR
ncbi:MAG TPA: cyclic nucleotide-binding domain-containing protein [Blastocatellia bacterium]|nr:cyclic nucleotide-binding domain-containing protein [Blastocatellia bacterium]